MTEEWLAKQVAELIAGNARIEARLNDVLPTVRDHEDRIRRGERDHATHAEVEATVCNGAHPVFSTLHGLGKSRMVY